MLCLQGVHGVGWRGVGNGAGLIHAPWPVAAQWCHQSALHRQLGEGRVIWVAMGDSRWAGGRCWVTWGV